jgi:transposase
MTLSERQTKLGLSKKAVAIPHDTVLYKQRHRIENMFGRIKDWRRVHTRYDRCAHLLLGNLHRRSRHILALINES